MGDNELPEAGAELQRERKARGELREGHLKAGRQQALDERRSRPEVARAPAEQEAVLNSTVHP